MPSTLIIVADDIRQRHALKDVGQSYGFEVMHCLPARQVDPAIASLTPALWVVDVEDESALLEQIGFEKPIVMGLLSAPAFNQRPQYLSWKKKVGLKLLKILGQPIPNKKVVSRAQPSAFKACSLSHLVQANILPDVWRIILLAGSMGGVESIKAFLDQLPSDMPICFLLVQHIDPYMQHRLPHILSRHNQWTFEMITHSDTLLRKGVVYVIPAIQQVDFKPNGILTLDQQKQPWPGYYQPSITDMMQRASRVFKQQLLTIVFSGMGDDGRQSAEYHRRQGGVIWAQTADSCACASQPDQMRSTGYVSFNDTPMGLAAQLIHEYKHSREKSYEYPIS